MSQGGRANRTVESFLLEIGARNSLGFRSARSFRRTKQRPGKDSILIHKSIYHMDLYLSAEEAAAILDISKPTLYAYVSRGLIRSLQGKDSRSRLYNRLDIDQLKG